jgi:hypothetical protein
MTAVRRVPIIQRFGDDMTLTDSLSDPLIRSVMAADDVDPQELASMLAQIAAMLSRRETGRCNA